MPYPLSKEYTDYNAIALDLKKHIAYLMRRRLSSIGPKFIRNIKKREIWRRQLNYYTYLMSCERRILIYIIYHTRNCIDCYCVIFEITKSSFIVYFQKFIIMSDLDLTKNHVYVGNIDKALEWSGFKDGDTSSINDEHKKRLVFQVRDRIKNYLQLDNVSFLFGTGSSIHLGAAGIQNIPRRIENDILRSESGEVREDFKKYVTVLQRPLLNSCRPEKDKKFKDDKDGRKWDLIYDGTYIRNYEEADETDKANKTTHYGEILLQFEQLLNYLTALLFQHEAEKDDAGSKRIQNLITALKKSLFGICDVHGLTTSDKDLVRIKEKGHEVEFRRNKYLFHERFLKSLMQRPLNLQRANIFTSNYDLAFEYAFDNLGIKYIDGFSGFHHRYFKPETFNYDIFYPGSTTAGKVQRIEKVVRYFKIHGSISWVSDNQRTPSNVYGIEEMPIELIKRKAEDDDDEFNYGNLMIYPTAVKKTYTLDLPYSELFRHFSYCVSQPQSVLFTVGYSFCDEHINDLIYQALSNPSFTLIVIDLKGCEKSTEINRLRSLNDPRIIIIEGDFLGDFLTLADTLMPDFLDTSSEDKVAHTLNKLLNESANSDGK